MAKGKSKQIKLLCEWAEEGLFCDQVTPFLKLCKQENYDPMAKVSQDKFLKIKKRFGYWW